VLNLELKCSRPKSLPQPSPKSKNLNPSLFTSLFNEKIMFTLNANYVMFGECMANPRKQMIIIELKEAITETFVKPLRESCSINNKFEYKTIDLKRGQIIQKWAKKRIN
ncbi:unnamed protein product, partial [Medioppia subpectinata]